MFKKLLPLFFAASLFAQDASRPSYRVYSLSSISNTLATTPDKVNLRFLPGWLTNTYRAHWGSNVLNPPLLLQGKKDITIDLTGCNFYLVTNIDYLVINGCSNVWIHGGNFIGTKNTPKAENPSQTNMSGVYGVIRVEDSYGVHFRNMSFIDQPDHGILVDNGRATFASTNGSVVGCYFQNIGGCLIGSQSPFDGDAIIPGAGWLISDNTILNCNRGIEVFPLLNGAGDSQYYNAGYPPTIIANNRIKNFIDHGIATYFCPAVITGNTVENTNINYSAFKYGIQVLGTNNNVSVVNNHISRCSYGITVSAGFVVNTNTIVARNVVSDCIFGMIFGGTYGLQIVDNVFSDAINMALHDGVTNNVGLVIADNTFMDCPGEASLYPFTVSLKNGLRNARIENNRFTSLYAPGKWAVNIGSIATNITFFNNNFLGYNTNFQHTFVPPIIHGNTNTAVYWNSNAALWVTWTAGGTLTNHSKIAGP